MKPTEQLLAYLELKQDLLFHKIESNKINYYIDQSLQAASKVAQVYKGKSIFDLYEEEKIDIEYSDDKGEFYKVKFRAQFEYDPKGNCKVTIYKKALEDLAEVVNISSDELLQIHLCHEFFHYHEWKNKEVVSDMLDSIVTLSVLGMNRHAHISRASEIAAHKFASEMMGLDVLPNYYDYEFLKQDENELNNFFEEQQKELDCLN